MTDPSANTRILGQHLDGETIDLVRGRFVDYVSHGSTLTRCRLVLHGPARGVVFHEGTFIDCEFVFRKPFKGFSWSHTVLRGCRFVGEIDNCQFGPRGLPASRGAPGAVERCDFSQAKLGWCEFYGCDVGGLRFPGWPTFVIRSPLEHQSEWMSIPFPESYAAVEQKMIGGLVPDMDVTGLAAVSQNAVAISRQHRVSVDFLRTLLGRHSFLST